MKKRLKNSADIACQMFCGWRLTTSKNRLVELGSGALEIHLLTGECFFEGVPVDPMTIGKELQLWFHKELLVQKISPEAILTATLKANIQLNLIPWAERKNKEQVFFTDNVEVRTDEIHRCVIECESEISTEKVSFVSRRRDIDEWPRNWPKAKWSYSKLV